MYKNYNPTDKESIYRYAKELEGKTFFEISEIYQKEYPKEVFEKISDDVDYKLANVKHKGGLGEIIEEMYFHYPPNSITEADFPEAKVELKVTPYKINKNGSKSAKERLIISMINYSTIVYTSFNDSTAWNKMRNLLLVYYLWDPDINNRLKYLISYVYMHVIAGKDLEIIRDDYELIREKVLMGKAHELSESDTIYLGAVTKAATSKDRTTQPLSDTLAKPRAFSLKTSYMTYILRNYILKDAEKQDSILKDEKNKKFKEYVLEKLFKHKGKKDTVLFEEYFGTKTLNSKHKYSRLIFEMLGIKTANAEEFEKANIVVKTLRLEKRNKIIESISFPSFKIVDLINQEWENSDVYEYFNQTKFLFVIFKGSRDGYYLHGAQFWNMPVADIDGALRKEWEIARNVFRDGVDLKIDFKTGIVKNNLPKKSNTKILHVRPHATKSAYLINGVKYGNGVLGRDTDVLPCGDQICKQCFWLNNDYILDQIKQNS